MKYARTEGKHVVDAGTAKKGEDYYCLTCSEPVVLKKGKILSHHFAHKSGAEPHDPETIEHWTAKHLIAEHRHQIFLGYKYECGCDAKPIWSPKTSAQSEAFIEHRVTFEVGESQKTFVADVYLRSSNVSVWVEIFHTHACPIDKIHILLKNKQNLYEVRASETIELLLNAKVGQPVTIPSTNNIGILKNCASCIRREEDERKRKAEEEVQQRVRQKKEQAFALRQARIKEEELRMKRRPCHKCSKWGPGYDFTFSNSEEIADDAPKEVMIHLCPDCVMRCVRCDGPTDHLHSCIVCRKFWRHSEHRCRFCRRIISPWYESCYTCKEVIRYWNYPKRVEWACECKACRDK